MNDHDIWIYKQTDDERVSYPYDAIVLQDHCNGTPKLAVAQYAQCYQEMGKSMQGVSSEGMEIW